MRNKRISIKKKSFFYICLLGLIILFGHAHTVGYVAFIKDK